VGREVESHALASIQGGAALATRVQRVNRRRNLRSAFLIAPAALFLLAIFIAPIAVFLFRSVDNVEIRGALPRTIAALATWNRSALPGDRAFAALAADLRSLDSEEAALLGRRLNYVIPGYRSLVTRTADRVRALGVDPGRDALVEIDPRWGDRLYWTAIANDSGRLTSYFALSAVDLAIAPDGAIVAAPSGRAVFRDVLGRTFWISGIVTLLCLAVGFPVAWVLANVPTRIASILLVFVLLPFWTSTLVRTTAWVLLLQREGLVNQLLIWLGLIREPLALIFNRAGVYIAMTHVLAPFLILPLYSVMKGIPREHMRAAASLGAPPVAAFLRVYLPQTMPGIAAGCTLVFVIALGFYVTPVLVGGPGDQMVSYFIAFYTNESVNWGMASALAALLLLSVAFFYAGAGGVVGFNRLRVR
jgi:putative spermidine/putrescine transport system permease protein